jgi:hypothetical protein
VQPISDVVSEVRAQRVVGYVQEETAIGTCRRLDNGVGFRLWRRVCGPNALRHPSASCRLRPAVLSLRESSRRIVASVRRRARNPETVTLATARSLL